MRAQLAAKLRVQLRAERKVRAGLARARAHAGGSRRTRASNPNLNHTLTLRSAHGLVNALLASGAVADSGLAGLLRGEGNDQKVGAAKGAGAIDATPLPDAPDLTVISCSATDWPAALDGGPGGSDAVGALARDMDRLAGSESGSDTEPSDWVGALFTW